MELRAANQHGKRPGQRQPRLQVKSKGRVFWLLPILLIAGWLGYQEGRAYFLPPQAILVLGGDPKREVFAAQFASQHPNLSIWVSSGSNPEYAEWVFEQAGIAAERVHLDYRAVDTVTNFTTIVGQLQSRGIHNIYLITSDYHMQRSRVIGEIVLGSRGINFKPIAVTSDQAEEPLEKSVRDGLRSLVWVVTGRTGTSLQGKF